MKQDIPTTKDRILNAANSLFYGEGIRAVSVDAIAEKAGITKRTLYYHFKSKDELVTGYLASRDQPNLKIFAKWFEETEGDLSDKIEAIFINLAKNSRHPKWKGCGFLRTAAELANMPGHPAIKIGAAHKKKFEAWLAEQFTETSIKHPNQLARHIILIMDGAFSTMLIHRDPSYIEAAGDAAKNMVLAALNKT
ncbi:TetR/AcrR family transcriptional regulator [Kiloniella sp.]|uniref:TetR/AcrR family transcriptional regulator n=1 Tax=Kiloniella sp. TaxID=1938587 RepID=UPI003A94C6C7